MTLRHAFLPLLAMTVLIGVERWHTYHEPLHGDLTQYAVIGHEWLQGRSLYADLIDHSPPARYLTYAAAEYLFGYNLRAIQSLNIFGSIVLLLGIFAAGCALGGIPGGLWAAGFWAVISGDLRFQGNQPWTELFINGTMVWGFVFLRSQSFLRSDRVRVLCAGICFALATLYWQPMAAAVALLLITYAVTDHPKSSLFMTGIIFAFWGITMVSFYAVGHLRAFMDLVFIFNRAYAGLSGGILVHLLKGLTFQAWPEEFKHGTLLFFLPLAGCAFIGMGSGLASKKRNSRTLLLAYGLGVLTAASLPGMFYAHYFQIILPPLALAAAGAVSLMADAPYRHARQAATAAGLIVLAMLSCYEIPFYRLTPEEWSLNKYGPEFLVTEHVGKELSQLLLPQETFYNWGTQTGLYFWSGKPLVSGAFYNFFLLSGPLANRLTNHCLTDLKRSPPELFIAVSPRVGGGMLYDEHPIYKWAKQYYRPIEWNRHKGAFLFYARRGGALEARILTGSVPAHFLEEQTPATGGLKMLPGIGQNSRRQR